MIKEKENMLLALDSVDDARHSVLVNLCDVGCILENKNSLEGEDFKRLLEYLEIVDQKMDALNE